MLVLFNMFVLFIIMNMACVKVKAVLSSTSKTHWIDIDVIQASQDTKFIPIQVERKIRAYIVWDLPWFFVLWKR